MNREQTIRELQLYSARISRKTQELFNAVSDDLRRLILDDRSFSIAQVELNRVYNEALMSEDFFQYFRVNTVNLITDVSYNQAVMGISASNKATFTRKIEKISLFDDEIILSKRIRSNYKKVVKDHKLILNQALKDGKGVIKIAKKINDSGGFAPEIPEYIDQLRRSKLLGNKLSESTINNVTEQISRIKNKGLKQSYERLVDAIDLNKPLEKYISNALKSKSRSYAERLARSEAINTQASVKLARHAKDKNVKWIYSKTSGSNPCNFCLAMASLGKIPFESAPKFIFHPNDSCTQHVVRDLEDVEPWSDKEFNQKLNSELGKFGKSSVEITKLRNLRENTIVDKMMSID